MRFPVQNLLLSALMLASCSSDPSAEADRTAFSAKPLEEKKAEPTLYVVNVDQLQLRDQPTQKGSKVLNKCQEGAFLWGTGQRSSQMEEAVLRGIPYKDVFVEVQTQEEQPVKGWLFAPGVTAIYVGSTENAPNLPQLAAFAGFLKALPTQEMGSGGKAWNYVQNQFGNASGALADAVYILLHQFLFRMEVEGEFYTQVEKLRWTPEDYTAVSEDRFDMRKYPESRAFFENGFRFEAGEGMLYPIADWQRLHAFFGPKVSPVMKKYLDQEVIEKRELETEDAGIVIPVEQIAERAVFWERFQKEHPQFVLADQVQISARWTRELLFFGADNTPLFDYQTKQIQPEFKAAWQMVQQKYPETQIAKKCKEITDLCTANGWKYTKEIEKWVATNQEQR